jgi:hypothetical protein
MENNTENKGIEETPQEGTNTLPEGDLGFIGGNVLEDKNPADDRKVMVERDEKGRLMKGVVLNPTGKKKGTRNFSTLFRDVIREVANSKGKTDIEIENDLAKRGILEALNGDFYFWESVMNRIHGKPATKITFDDELESVEVKFIKSKDEIKTDSDTDLGEVL